MIDAGKAIAALVPATSLMQDHLEVIVQGLPLNEKPLPFAALPTTAGTGAEVTRNAVIVVPDAMRKVSLRDAKMLPCLAVIDPHLTDDCARAVTLASGLDAITQVIEPYLCSRAYAPLFDYISGWRKVDNFSCFFRRSGRRSTHQFGQTAPVQD